MFRRAAKMPTTSWPLLIALAVSSSCLPADGFRGVERTLALIKPDGLRANHTGEIKDSIKAEGFKIVGEKETVLDEATARSFYDEHSERTFFPHLVEFMTSGPVLAMVLEKENAIREWRALMGPTNSDNARREVPNSLRAKFGQDGQSNCVHGSDTPEAASREMAYFFPATRGKSEELTTAEHDEL